MVEVRWALLRQACQFFFSIALDCRYSRLIRHSSLVTPPSPWRSPQPMSCSLQPWKLVTLRFCPSGAASSRRPEKYSPNLLRCFPWTLLGEDFSQTLSSRTGFFDVLALLNTSSDSCSLQSM